MATIPPPRITLLTAELEPVIVALCRVRTRLWQIARIDPLYGHFELGRWCQTHAYPHYSSLSPSGKWLSFAEIRGYTVGSPPRMDPCYFFDGASSYGPAMFLTETAINVVHGGFVKSSDGSRPPFACVGVSFGIGEAARLLLSKLNCMNKRLPVVTTEQVRKKGSWDMENRVSTTPDLGVVDDKVHSAVTLVSGELVTARLGIVTFYEIDHAHKATERWRVDLTRLYDDFTPRRTSPASDQESA